MFVAEIDGAVLGTYYLKPNSTGLADHVANAGYMTHPAARGRGVAMNMARDSFARAKAEGFRAMQFNLVIATNAQAVHLWQKIGLQVIGRLPEAFRPQAARLCRCAGHVPDCFSPSPAPRFGSSASHLARSPFSPSFERSCQRSS